MDPAHHDRVAFLRITSGMFNKGMKLRHVRAEKTVAMQNAHTFMAAPIEVTTGGATIFVVDVEKHLKL